MDSRASAVLYRFLSNQLPRKKIILPVNICSIIPAIIKKIGYELEYVDIDANDLCPDKEMIVNKIKKGKNKYFALLYNYTYGVDKKSDELFKYVKNKYNIKIIDDKASNLPSLECSTYADITLYSTGYAKQVDLNYGGYGISNNSSEKYLADREMIEIEYENKKCEISINSFEKNVKDYFNIVELKKVSILNQKKKINEIYTNNLPKSIQLGDSYNDWRFNIIVNNKDEILKEIFANDLFASNHFKPMSDKKDEYPVAHKLHSQVINLFNDFHYTEEQAYRTCEIINTYL